MKNYCIGGDVLEDSLLLVENMSPRFSDGFGFDSQSPLLMQEDQHQLQEQCDKEGMCK